MKRPRVEAVEELGYGEYSRDDTVPELRAKIDQLRGIIETQAGQICELFHQWGTNLRAASED